MQQSQNILLTADKTVADYWEILAAGDKEAAGDLVVQRLRERYVRPAQLKGIHGFTKMAIVCLLIETYQSFVEGRAESTGRGKQTFRTFFENSASMNQFSVGKKDWFYKNVRCGILHQAEVRDGWRIHRRGALLNTENRSINADLMLKELDEIIGHYPQRLANDDAVWANFVAKMEAVCATCVAGPDVGPG